MKLVNTADDQIHTCIGTSGTSDGAAPADDDGPPPASDEHGTAHVMGPGRRR